MLIKRIIVALLALAILTPNVSFAGPYGWRDPVFKNYIKYDVQRGMFIDTTGRMDGWCRPGGGAGWRDPVSGRSCWDPQYVPPIKLVIPQSIFSSSAGGGTTSAPMRYHSAKEKLTELAHAVAIATGVRVDAMFAPKIARNVQPARTLLIGLASDKRLVGNGELQDILACSEKDIRNAVAQMADVKFAKTADSIWTAFSAMRVTEVADARHRRPVITDVMAAVSRLYGVAWSDVRMYANDPKHSACGEAMQVTAVIACDYLRKDARSVSRVLACSESDIAKLLDRARTNASGQLKANIRAACRELGIVSV